jgi:phospholipase D1/2
LIDGANYYAALRSSLLKAEKSVFLVGWDIDSRIRLAGESLPDDGAPEHLRDFLEHLVQENAELRIHVLMWDFSVLYALEREPLPALNFSWSTPARIEVCLDDVVPLGSSHHQKLVIIDGKLAFCGGLDLTGGRWDTRDHAPDNQHRKGPDGEPYGPFHDMQSVVDGETAQALTDLVSDRWERAACRTPYCPETKGDPWPDDVPTLFEDQQIAIARTIPPLGDRDGVHEIQQLYFDMISNAETLIYLENQYFTSGPIACALVDRLKARPNLELVMVSSKEPFGFLEAHSMNSGRRSFMRHFEENDLMDRVRSVYPRVPDDTDAGQEVQIHAKLTIIDDQLFRVGSANLTNRSMGTDGECDLAIQAKSAADRETILAIRNDLLAEHLGMSIEEVAKEIESHGNLRSLIDARKNQSRTLIDIDFETDDAEPVAKMFHALTDPERPGDASQFAGDMLSARPGGFEIRGRYIVIASFILLVLLYLWWA